MAGNRQARDHRRNFSLPPTASYRRADRTSNSGCRTQLRVRQDTFGPFSQMSGFTLPSSYRHPSSRVSDNPIGCLPWTEATDPPGGRAIIDDQRAITSVRRLISVFEASLTHGFMICSRARTASIRYVTADVACHNSRFPLHATGTTAHRI
jgi:hypothetical protein